MDSYFGVQDSLWVDSYSEGAGCQHVEDSSWVEGNSVIEGS